MRQHALGPYPFDPNLIRQGIPPDDRVDANERLYAPVEGTPLPPGAMPAGTPPGLPPPGAAAPVPAGENGPPVSPAPEGNSLNGTPIPPGPVVEAPPVNGAIPAAQSAFAGSGSGGGPSVAVAHYDPRTGDYLSPDGLLQTQTNLAAGAAPKSWKDLLPS
jgi:hypothetical protein